MKIVITGATSGIGKSVAEKLADQGAVVLIACRNLQKATEVAGEINLRPQCIKNNGRATAYYLDLEDFATIPLFVEKLREDHPSVDVLINNAGFNKEEIFPHTKLQTLFQVNYLGHFYLLREMVNILSKVEDGKVFSARVINISSVAHHVGQTDFHKAAYGQYTTEMIAKRSYYADSKFYLNLLTMEINRRFFHFTNSNSGKTRPDFRRKCSSWRS